MKTSLGLAIVAFFASSQTVFAGSIRGFTTSDVVDVSKPMVSNRYLLTKERRLLAHEGVMRTLIIRVTDGEGKQPFTDARREADTWFGTHGNNLSENTNSMASLYDQCSGGKLNFVPATHANVVHGVLELTTSKQMTGLGVSAAGHLIRAEFNALNQELGIEFEAVSIILPEGVTGNGGLAGMGRTDQFYAGGADRSLELVMHEFGHDIGFHHSGVPNEGSYDDNHCLMGCCAGAQQMCFNAAKSWYSGWYNEAGKDGHIDVNHFDTPGQWWSGNLVGLDDYLTADVLFDQDEHGLVLRTKGGLYAMFNRGKGVNAGVRAYKDEVVIVQQWGEGGKSSVLATLGAEQKHYKFSADYYDFDVNFELCEIVIPPVVVGPLLEIKGTASQSSTAAGAEASRAIDGNLDQTWAGNSVTHTTGDEEDLDPWWALQLDEETKVEHVRVFNRADCCSDRLNNAILELYNSDDEIIFTRNLGTAEDVEDVYLGSMYHVKKIQIKHFGYKVLSLAEVQLFAPLTETLTETRTGAYARQPDYARIVTYLSSGDEPQISCETTLSPTQSTSPSVSPTNTFQPTIYRAVPSDVVLLRDNSPCIFQSNPLNHPDRYKCIIQPTKASSEPGGYFNNEVTLSGEDGCVITVQPVTWSWKETAFIFQSDSSLGEINACFATNFLLTEIHTLSPPTMSPLAALSDEPSIQLTLPLSDGPSEQPSSPISDTPTAQPSSTKHSIPSDVTLLRDSSLCVFQSNSSNHPDRFKCFVEPTAVSSKPGGYGNSLTRLWGAENCKLDIRPVTWAWAGNMFIFGSSDSLDAINTCFRPSSVIKNSPIAMGVVLKRDGSDCISQINPKNHPDRFKCFIEPTEVSSKPGGYDNTEVPLVGFEGCVIKVQPVTWAWEGNAFIFESSASLDTIKDCFVSGQLVTAAGAGPSNVFE